MSGKLKISNCAFSVRQGEMPMMIVSPVAVMNERKHPQGITVPIDCVAQWDTGATHNLITPELAMRAGLEKLEVKADVNGFGAKAKADVYKGSLVLTHGMVAPDQLFIADDNLAGTGADVIIGLSIINNCDFALTHAPDGDILLSVSAPPSRCVDFV